MKKFILVLLGVFLYSDNLKYYLFSINMDYREISNGYVIDKDQTNYGDLNGIGISYESYRFIPYFINAEYSHGTSKYSGQTQSGQYLETTNKNVYIFNINAGLHIFNNPYYLNFGYRLWNRGKSNYEGDYDEKYYWKYIGFGYKYIVKFSDFILKSDLNYEYALNPKLNVYLGSGATLDLGETDGLKFKFSADYKYSNNIMLSFLYKIQLWHINVSNVKTIEYNNQDIVIYEPESITLNQYLSIGLLFKF